MKSFKLLKPSFTRQRVSRNCTI